MDEVFISFVPQQIEVTTWCLSVCTGQTEAENYILSHTFLESKWSCRLSQVLTCIRIQSIISKGLQYLIMSTLLYLRKPHFHKLIIICLRENGCFCSEGSAIEEVIVDEGVCCTPSLCAFAVLQAGWRGCHTNLAVARQPCLETRWYGLEIMSVKERVKRCTHAQIFCTLKRRLGLAERSCYSIRTWTSANGKREELEIMHVGTQLCVCAPLHYLWSLLISCQNTADDIWLAARLRKEVFFVTIW